MTRTLPLLSRIKFIIIHIYNLFLINRSFNHMDCNNLWIGSSVVSHPHLHWTKKKMQKEKHFTKCDSVFFNRGIQCRGDKLFQKKKFIIFIFHFSIVDEARFVTIFMGLLATVVTYALVSIERAVHELISRAFDCVRDKFQSAMTRIGTFRHPEQQRQRRYPLRNRRAPIRLVYWFEKYVFRLFHWSSLIYNKNSTWIEYARCEKLFFIFFFFHCCQSSQVMELSGIS